MGGNANDKWFHANISRQKAEELLANARLDGSFIVRPSESIHGAYALSLLYQGGIHTYRILPTPTGSLAVQTADGVQKKKFSCIDDLVTEYRKANNGLCCGLTNPVGQTRAPPALPHRNVFPSAPPHSFILRPPGMTGPVNPPPYPSRQVLPVPQSTPTADQAESSCVICMDSVKDAYFQPCGHVCCCMECSQQVNECPVCRKKITKKMKAYL